MQRESSNEMQRDIAPSDPLPSQWLLQETLPLQSLDERVTQWLATASEADTNEYTEKLLPPNMCLAKGAAGALVDSSLAYEMFVDDSVADAYTKIAPGLPADDFRRLLAHAWMAPRGPDSVVKLIFQLGNVRTDGGGQRNSHFFLLGYLWLLQHFPATALHNLHRVPKHTCLKHLLDIVMLAMDAVAHGCDFFEAAEAMQAQREAAGARREALSSSQGKKARNKRRRTGATAQRIAFAASIGQPLEALEERNAQPEEPAPGTKRKLSTVPWKTAALRDQYKAYSMQMDTAKAQATATEASQHIETRLRKNGRSQLARLLRRRRSQVMCSDSVPEWLSDLYNAVIDIFTNGIIAEMQLCRQLQTGPHVKVRFTGRHGLFAKHFPTFGGLHDNATDLANAIARDIYAALFKMCDLDVESFAPLHQSCSLLQALRPSRFGLRCHHKTENRMHNQLTAAHVNSMGKRGHRHRRKVISVVCTVLRRAAGVTECFLHAGQYHLVDYDRVTAQCMQRMQKHFRKHDPTRFAEWLCRARNTAQRELEAQPADADAMEEPGARVKTATLTPNSVVWRAFTAYALLKERLPAAAATPASPATDASPAADALANASDASDAMSTSSDAASDAFSVEQLNVADLDEQCKAAVEELECCALQWNGIVRTARADLRKTGLNRRRWVPMVDTSGSMEDERYDGQPMEERPLAVGVALSLLLAEINEGCGGHIEGKIIAFASKPVFIQAFQPPPPGAPPRLREIGKVAYNLVTNSAASGFSTNLVDAVRLAATVEADAVVCFTDMGFDMACSSSVSAPTWNTALEEIAMASGGLPTKLVLWNLAQTEIGQPVETAAYDGLIQLSGWSPAVLKYFLAGNFQCFNTSFFLRTLFDEKYADVDAHWRDKRSHEIASEIYHSGPARDEYVQTLIAPNTYKFQPV